MRSTRSAASSEHVELTADGRSVRVVTSTLSLADLASSAFGDSVRTADDARGAGSDGEDDADPLDALSEPRVDLANQLETLSILSPAFPSAQMSSATTDTAEPPIGRKAAKRLRSNRNRTQRMYVQIESAATTVQASDGGIGSLLEVRTTPDGLETKPLGALAQTYEETRDFVVIQAASDRVTRIVTADGAIVCSISQVFLTKPEDREALRKAGDRFVSAIKSDSRLANARGDHINASDGRHAQYSRTPLFSHSQGRYAQEWAELHAEPIVQRIVRTATNHTKLAWPAAHARSYDGVASPVWTGGPNALRKVRDPAWTSPNGMFQQLCLNGGLSTPALEATYGASCGHAGSDGGGGVSTADASADMASRSSCSSTSASASPPSSSSSSTSPSSSSASLSPSHSHPEDALGTAQDATTTRPNGVCATCSSCPTCSDERRARRDRAGALVVCRKHRDSRNWGPCCVQSESGGYDDPTRELFALILYDLRIIVKVHPYSFVSYPSGLITHGNVHLPIRAAHLAANLRPVHERASIIAAAEEEVESTLGRAWRRSWVWFTQGMWQRWAEATALGTRDWVGHALDEAAAAHAKLWGARDGS